MNPCADFRYRLEEAVLEEIGYTASLSSLAEAAPTREQAILLTNISRSDQANAMLCAALISGKPMSVCQPVAFPDTALPFHALLDDVIRSKKKTSARYALLCDYAPTQEIRYLLLSAMQSQLQHAQILSALRQAAFVE